MLSGPHCINGNFGMPVIWCANRHRVDVISGKKRLIVVIDPAIVFVSFRKELSVASIDISDSNHVTKFASLMANHRTTPRMITISSVSIRIDTCSNGTDSNAIIGDAAQQTSGKNHRNCNHRSCRCRRFDKISTVRGHSTQIRFHRLHNWLAPIFDFRK
jgi:hypothetical protein